MFKRKISREDLKVLAWPLSLVLVIILGSFLILGPKIKKIYSLKTENNQQTKEARVLEAKAGALEELSTAEIKEKLNFALKALPVEVNLPWLWSTINEISGRRSLELKKFNADEISIAKGVFDCTLNGSENDLGSFFADLAETLPLSAVEEIKLFEADGDLGAKFVLKSFTLPLEESRQSEKIGLLTEKEEKILKRLEQFSSVSVPFSGPLPSIESSTESRKDPFFF